MRRGVSSLLSLCAAACALASCQGEEDPPPAEPVILSEAGAGARAIPARAAYAADNGNWEMPGKDYASTRFSSLNQVTAANVSKLGLSFTFSTGTTRGFEAPPLVVGG